jgi:LPXTG-site transpeptidase (sortase) family protein
MRGTLVFAAALCALLALVGPPASLAVTPPNPNDPCATNGHNTCGTSGVGFYRDYKFGTRWFGDFRNAIPGTVHTFCLDLGYWYPSPTYEYREDTSGGLTNKLGKAVPLVNQQKIAYAIWAEGRTTDPDQQAAVMLYVHSLMGDARPGEVDPAALGSSAVTAAYNKVAHDAARLHGPYRLLVTLPDSLTPSQKATATIKLLGASGAGVPNVQLTLTATGATGVPKTVQTDSSGTAQVALGAPSTANIALTVKTDALASTLPRVFHPTTAAAGPNGQRLALPDSQTLTQTETTRVSQVKIDATTAAAPSVIVAGGTVRDKITITGALASYHGTIAVRIYGPFETTAAIRCSGTPVWKGTVEAKGSGVFTTPAATIQDPGYYTFQETIPGDTAHIGLTTPCAVPAEGFKVEVQPKVVTTVSSQKVAPGTAISDSVNVSGLGGEQVNVLAFLYGPYPAREAINCSGQPIWTGTIPVSTDGDYDTDSFTVTVPGFYAYREQIAAGEFVRATQTTCADVAETTVVSATPKVTTQVSAQQAAPGASVYDSVIVSGLGALSVPVQVDLFGPFATKGGIGCTGKPFWSGSIVATGDGTYKTPPVVLARAGYYTFRESLAAGPANDAFIAPCAQVSETTLARPSPVVTTLASSDVVLPGGAISDRIQVSGVGKTAVGIVVQLFGPFATRAGISCTSNLYWQGRVTAKGDGVLRSPAVRLKRAGFYVFRERIVASPLVPASTTPCGEVAETSLARPLIITGRDDHPAYVRVAATGGSAPTRVRIALLGIDAPVSAVGIDLQQGVLAAPSDIHRLGWWKDGEPPGSSSGATLIAGHVDSAKAGAGAFFGLKKAKAGDTIEVTTADGRTHTYRVVSNRAYLKKNLPADIYSQKGRPRLVLVTCGGPFDQATGHYRDNVVVTAVPVAG